MVAVVVESSFPEPRTLDWFNGLDLESSQCLGIHGCRPLVHSLSSDGIRCACVYDAPDAETMRRLADRMSPGLPPRIWTATTHYHPSDPNADSPLFRRGEAALALVPRTLTEPTEFDTLQALEDAKAGCLTLHRVRFIKSFFSIGKDRMACLYVAPDLEAVRKSTNMTGLPFDEVMAARCV